MEDTKKREWTTKDTKIHEGQKAIKKGFIFLCEFIAIRDGEESN
jgi:hypothetical protein